ncbi:MAG: hypothetical protein CVV28_11995, partial [Methanobacteriales archaeon HGW-Methanobacteriales-1]
MVMFKRVLLLVFVFLSFFVFLGDVSAASNSSLTWAEVENSSYAVQTFTESHGDIPSSVSVSGKKVTDNAYLEVLCKAVVKANTNDKTSVSVVGRGNAPAPSGTAKGTLSKSQYLTVAKNIKSFYTDNNRAPNYAESSIGNIRYETLVYMYSKVMNYYRVHDTLPSSISFMYVSGVSSSGAYVDATPPTISNNLAGGSYNTLKTVTLTASDNSDANPRIYYSLNNGAWSNQVKTVSLSLNQGRTDLRYYGTDVSGNVGAAQYVTYYIDTTVPVVNASLAAGAYNESKSVTLTASDNLDSNPVIYYSLNNGTWGNQPKNVIFNLNLGLTYLQFYAMDRVGNAAVTQNVSYVVGTNAPPIVTVSLAGGSYNIYQNVTLTACDDFDLNPVVFYSFNNGTKWYNQTNNVTLGLYPGKWDLLYYGMGSEGNCGLVQNVSYFIDTTGPLVWANLTTGLYNSSQIVNLTVSDNFDVNPLVYYTLNGVNPTNASSLYTGALNITNTTTLKFLAVDNLGNQGDVITEHYIFASIGNLNIGKGYSSIQGAIDDLLTLDGHVIGVGSGTYTENVVIGKNITIRSVPGADVIVQSFNSLNPAFTVNSGGSGSIIWGFNINGSSNSYGIYLNSTENCTIWNNTITGNKDGVYLQNAYGNTIAANNITNSKAQYMTGSGIYLTRSFRNTIVKNNLIGNDHGIWLIDSEDNEIFENTIAENLNDAINIYYQYDYGAFPYSDINNNKILRNNISDNGGDGIRLSDNRRFPRSQGCIIHENTISNNLYGIFVNYGSVDVYGNDISCNEWEGVWISGDLDVPPSYIHFNRISQNQHDGLFCNGALVNATNNWWGTNSPVYTEGTYDQFLNSTADIFLPQGSTGIVLYGPWLGLTVTPTSYKVSEGKIYESTITADLTHNSNGEDTSSQGHVPDGIPVNFIAQYGDITNLQYTRKGKASSTLVLNPLIQSATGVLALVDDEFAYTGVDKVAKAVINVGSTALDLSTNQMIDFSHEIPLNDSTSWVSVLWKETGLFHGEIDLIVNGNVVASRNVINAAYFAYQNSYSLNVFEQIRYINYLFLSPVESTTFVPNQYLKEFITLNHLENLTISQLEDFVLFVVQEQNNFTDNEINFIKNNRNYFIDLVGVQMFYPGDAVKTINIVDPDNNGTLSMNCPGNPIFRVSPMVYFDGYSADANGTTYDVGYEGIRSFAIATTEVTDSVVQYWLGKKSLFAPGAMKAAYGTFLTSLLVIKCHDVVADQAADRFNVTWCRTTPVVVSCLDDAASSYITGEMDHRMGMDVTGAASNVWAFRYACSLSFSPIEQQVGNPDGAIGSVTMGIGERIFNGETPEMFMSNGYLVLKIKDKDDLILLVDPETGIVRDIAT